VKEAEQSEAWGRRKGGLVPRAERSEVPGRAETSEDALGRLVRGHMPALDGLRGIAILLVLAHTFDVIQTRSGTGHDLDLVLDTGWIGVQLFFVLSGFLITGILLDTRDRPHYFRSFWIRRALRIFPLYFGVLTVATIAGAASIYLWTYSSNFAAPLGHAEPTFPHFWSLAVEEQFYLVWPFVVWLGGRRGVIALSFILTVVAIASRIYVRSHLGPEATYQFTPCRMDALAIGAGVAALIRGDNLRRFVANARASLLGAIGFALIVGAFIVGHVARTSAKMQIDGYTLLAIGFGVLLIGVLPPHGAPARILSWSPLRRIGMYSYGMYVFHAPFHILVGIPLLERLHWTQGAAFGVAYMIGATLVTLGLAALSYHLYEKRFLALKQRFTP
jgi:peptidoglycan/LPS O-acetylase OafA/YrhL